MRTIQIKTVGYIDLKARGENALKIYDTKEKLKKAIEARINSVKKKVSAQLFKAEMAVTMLSLALKPLLYAIKRFGYSFKRAMKKTSLYKKINAVKRVVKSLLKLKAVFGK